MYEPWNELDGDIHVTFYAQKHMLAVSEAGVASYKFFHIS